MMNHFHTIRRKRRNTPGAQILRPTTVNRAADDHAHNPFDDTLLIPVDGALDGIVAGPTEDVPEIQEALFSGAGFNTTINSPFYFERTSDPK